MVDMGEIQRVDLREVWPNEAQDFTPWLAENLDKLGEALGLDLELRGEEQPVGPFFLDVLAYDSGSGRPVIIENQLEVTDHNHLGQLLTYAAGYDAYAMVWLAREFRGEHRAALDWLNQRTGEDTAFFGVVVEAWRIDGSKPAPHFRLVATPNNWQKRTAKSGTRNGGAALSTRERRFQDFCVSLFALVEGELRPTNPKPRQWCSFYSDFRGIWYNPNFYQREQSACVELSIHRNDKEWNEYLFDELLARKESIESQIGTSLERERREALQHCRIRTVRDGSLDYDDENLEEIRDWMVDRLLAFKRVFTPHLQELIE